MTQFLLFLLLLVVGGKKGRQEVWRICRQEASGTRQSRWSKSTNDLLDATEEIMADSTADMLSHHRRRKATRKPINTIK